MNMISTGAFLTEMDASNKQPTVAEKFAAVWEKKNAKAARAGGVSLMALSLAACGGSSSTTTTTETETETETPAEPTTPVVTPASLALTTSQDIFTGTDLTTAADSVTGTSSTFGSTDVIVDGTAGDGDTLTISATADVTTGTVSGIENVVFNNSAVGNLSHNLANVADGTVVANVGLAGGSTVATFTNVGDITVKAGTGIKTLTVTEAAKASTSVFDAGSATAVNLTGAAATSDLDLTVNGDITMDIATADQVTITATAASAITLNDTASGVAKILTTSADASLVAATNLADFAGDTVTGFTSVKGVYKGGDYTKVGGKLIIASGADAAEDLEIADGTVISTLDTQVIQLKPDDDKSATTDTGITATVELDVANAAGVKIVDGNTDASEDTVTTLNVVANKATTSFTVTTVSAADATLNLSGAKAVTLLHVDGGGSEKLTVNAADLAGALTFTSDANALSVTGGAGDDAITVTTGTKFAVVGGAGTDTLVTGVNMTTGTFSGFEKLTANTGDDFLASQLSGQTLVINQLNGAGTAGSLSITGAKSVDITSMDFSNVHFTEANDGVNMTGAQQDTTKMTADTAVTITGSAGADTLLGFGGADTISGGDGADTITGGAGSDTLTGGEGGDTINTGTGSDTVDLTETTAATDTVVVEGTKTDVTTIKAFVAGADSNDVIKFALSDIEALTAVTNLTDGRGTDVAVAANNTMLVKKVDTSGVDIGGAANMIITIDGNYSSTDAVEDAIEDGGAYELVFGNLDTVGDTILIAYDNGTDSRIAAVTTSAVIADGANAASNTLTVTDYVILEGVADATKLVTADFTDFVA